MRREAILLMLLVSVIGLCANVNGDSALAGVFTPRAGTVPLPPVLIYPADGESVLNGELLSWQLAPGSADALGCDIYIDEVLVSECQTNYSYRLSGLAAGTHTWHVIARDQAGFSPPSEMRSFVIESGVEIGDGDQNYHLPINPRFNYNYTQSIFLQSEIDLGNSGGQSAPCLIESIAFYWNGAGGGDNSCGWNIYMGHTDRTSFAGNTDWLPVGELMQVFAGYLNIPAVAGWIEIELDTPFMYDNAGNLVIAVQERSNRNDPGDRYFHSTCTPDQYRSIISYDHVYPEPDNPPFGVLKTAFPNIQIRFGSLPSTPILSITPQSMDFGPVFHEEATTRLLMVSNAGTGTVNLAATDVSITGPNASEFSLDTSSLPVSLEAGQRSFIPITVTGLSEGEISASLRIFYEGQNHEIALNAEALPPESFTIGSGVMAHRYPFGSQYGNECTAALYTAEQIGCAGVLDMIAWNCARPSNNIIPYKIWAKNTSAAALSEIPWGTFVYDMTLVKEGVFTPESTGWHTFELDTGFTYEGENLIIAVQTSCSGSNLGGVQQFWFNNVSAPRVVFWDGYYISGHLTDALPNILMHLNRGMTNDLEAISLSGNLTPTVGSASNYIVRLRNNGNSDQSNYQVKLMSADNVELATIAGPPIHSGRTIDVVVSWTPTAADATTIYAKVELADDEIPSNDRTLSIGLVVNPAEVFTFTVGSGDQLARIPIDMYERKNVFQTLYYPDELAGYTGEISGVSFYTRFYYSEPDSEIRIWLGETMQDNLDDGFVPTSQLTRVFTGQVSFPNGEAILTIPFDQPYQYQGGNLVMMVYKYATTYGGYSSYFKCQTSGSNRSRKYIAASPHEHWDFDALPAGTLSGQFPKTTLMLNPAQVGYVTGTVMDSSGYPLSGVTLTNGEVSTNTNSGGIYILNLPAGSHTLTISAAGYHSQTVENVVIGLGQQIRLNFILADTPNDDPQAPALTTALKGNYPNPFNPETTISYSVAQPGRVKLQIFNIKGQLVRTLVDEEHATGHYRRIFDARDNRGRSISSGVYLIRMDAPGYRKTSKMMLMQ